VNTFWGMRLGEKYYKDVWNIDPYAVIGRFQGPVLILHGDKDRIVEQSVSDRAATIYKNAEYHVIPGGEHGFSGEAFQQVKRYIQTFMKR
jgi:cinII